MMRTCMYLAMIALACSACEAETSGTREGGGDAGGMAGQSEGAGGEGGAGGASVGGEGGEGGEDCAGPLGADDLAVCRAIIDPPGPCRGDAQFDACVSLLELRTCTAEIMAWVGCGGLAGCNGSGCPEEGSAVEACLGGLPQAPYIDRVPTGDESCREASLIMGFPGPYVVASCDMNGSGVTCECEIDGELAGTCDVEVDEPWSDCDLYAGCCRRYWPCLGPVVPSGDVGCSGESPDGSCGCSWSTPDGPYVTHCEPDETDGLVCECKIGDDLVGSCTADPEQDCDFVGPPEEFAGDHVFGCCARFW